MYSVVVVLIKCYIRAKKFICNFYIRSYFKCGLSWVVGMGLIPLSSRCAK